MSKFKPFRCGECGDTVKLVAKAGRVSEYRRGVSLPVPDDFEIPTCPTCGEQYFTVALSDALADRQAELLPEWKRTECAALIDHIRKQHQVTLRQIEGACAVTPTYLSHVLAGGKQTSLTLLRLLQAFALRPDELERQLAGTHWAETLRECSRPSRSGRPSVTVGLAVGPRGQGAPKPRGRRVPGRKTA